MKILVAGDSFAADWSVKHPQGLGWPNLLAQQFDVTNVAQAGVGEYKILKQIISAGNLNNYDWIIVSHTIPYRVHTRKHPVHYNDALHHNADLIYTDVEYHSCTVREIFNRPLRTAMNWFNWHFDLDYQETVYELVRDQVNRLVAPVKNLVIDNSLVDRRFVKEQLVIDIEEIKKKNPGLINHLSEHGNQLVYNQILNAISN
jgi:hypothetical protein